MNLDLCPDQIVFISIRGRKYPISISGEGTPCLVIGTGTLIQRTLSKKLKKKIKLYSSDLYWDNKFSLGVPCNLTMEIILEDIRELAETLSLKKFILLGHSCFGLVALEFAKKYPDLVSGVIMIGTPLNWNPASIFTNNKIFYQYAEENRKRIDAERRRVVEVEDLSQLSASERFLREYVFRDAARYWHISDFDCSKLWEDYMPGEEVIYFLDVLLSHMDTRIELKSIQIPIFLAAGLSDYDSCPAHTWPTLKKLPPHMEISIFKESGHYPHYEEPELFDEKIMQWIYKHNIVPSVQIFS